MHKIHEISGVLLVLLSTVGLLGAIYFYESIQTKKRNAIDLQARPVSTWSKKVLRVKKGKLVRIRVINKDTVTHGFAIPELDIKERIIHPGQNEIVEFTPEWEGEYDYKCTIQCSRKRHVFMKGKLIVEE